MKQIRTKKMVIKKILLNKLSIMPFWREQLIYRLYWGSNLENVVFEGVTYIKKRWFWWQIDWSLSSRYLFFGIWCEPLLEVAVRNCFTLLFLTETELKGFLRYCNKLRQWNKQTVVEHFGLVLHNNHEIM